jgi:tetratricopeptide (TPR) repeat protein
MAEVVRTSFREDLARISEALDAPGAAGRKAALKADIIALFKAVDREIADLGTLKGEIKGLVSRWKAIDDGDDEGLAPRQPAAPAVEPTRSDHLNASSHIEKGWSLISLGEHAAAEAALHKALALVPNDLQAVSLLGWAQMLQAKYDEALLNFQSVLQREPANALARVNVGYICLKKGIFGEAIEHLSRTIRLDNDRKATLYAHLYLGLLYFERDMYEDAESFLRKAIALGPNLVEAYYELGRALWFGGEADAARTAWREGVAANKFSPWGKRCAEVLRHVEAGGMPSR